METVKKLFEQKSINLQESNIGELKSLNETTLILPKECTWIELIFALIGSKKNEIDKHHLSIIKEYLIKITRIENICTENPEIFFQEEYLGLTDVILGFDTTMLKSNNPYIILAVTDDFNNVNNIITKFKSAKLILIATRIEGKFHLIPLVQTKNGFITITRSTEEYDASVSEVNIKRLKSLFFARELIDNSNSKTSILPHMSTNYDISQFENNHFNRDYKPQNIGRDYLAYQFYDALGNRTLDGFNGIKDDREGIVLTGGSSMWCREHPFQWTIEGNLRRDSKLKISNLAGCGEILDHEFGKLQHYIKYKGVPRIVISYTFYNDLYSLNETDSILESRFMNSIGYFLTYSSEASQIEHSGFYKRIIFILKLFDYLATENKYKHYLIMQPYLFRSSKQQELLTNYPSMYCEKSIKSIKSRIKYAELRSNYISEVATSMKFKSIEFLDWRDYLKNEDKLMFYDWVHLSRMGAKKISNALLDIINS